MEDIKKLVGDVRVRIVAFIFFYIALIALGAALIVATIYLTPIVWDYLLDFSNAGRYRSAGFLGVILITWWGVIVLTAIYMVKPIFKFSVNKKPGRVEVFEKDCPKLFETVREVAAITQCPMPKHLYLSADVNACVFYDTSFWSIFFPVKKNLEIGLGLFHKMSADEVKSIIAHEFGHFSQNSMKVGSAVYVSNTVLYNLVYGDDAVDRWMNNLCNSRFDALGAIGNWYNSLTGVIKKLVVMMYRFIQVKYLRLSRAMEFDADRVACQSIGSDTFISALSKLEYLSMGEEFYNDRLRSLLDSNKRIGDYLTAYELSTDLYLEIDKVNLTFDQPTLAKQEEDYKRVSIGNVWQSHPSLEDRIAHAREQQGTPIRPTAALSWSLITPEIRERISVEAAKAYYDKQWESLIEMSIADYREWMPKDAKGMYVPSHFRPYLGRNIVRFDISRVPLTETQAPINEANTVLLQKYMAALDDEQMLWDIKNKELVAPEYYYDKKSFKRKKAPIEQHEQYLKKLTNEVMEIDIAMYQYLMTHVENPEALKGFYQLMFNAANTIDEEIAALHNKKADLIYEFDREVNRTKKQFRALIEQTMDCESSVMQQLKKLDFELAKKVVHPDVIEYIQTWMNGEHPVSINTKKRKQEISGDGVNTVFKMINALSDIYAGFIYYGREQVYLAFDSVYNEEAVAQEA
ncbi:MAG: M48 family metalloprotease [Mediterranea sp.]|jgi:Zn-dependent protease with chaperone function|nr:M48 family metalloprotease [Mediterranea sp.]